MNTQDIATRGKKLLLLDGSRNAIEIVKQAHKLGVHVVIADRNSPTDSPAKLHADEHFETSITDEESIVTLANELQIDGVLPGFSDKWLHTYPRIAQRANLPSYATAEQIELFTNKDRYKKVLKEYGVPTIEDFSAAQARAGEIADDKFPLIVKPVDGSGSRGISIAETQEELRTSLEEAERASGSGAIVVERYLPGEEATVFWTFQDGEYYVSLVMNRHILEFGDGHRLPVGYTSPSSITPSYMAEVAPKVRQMLAGQGVKNGLMFMQGLVRGGTFYTYDIGYRFTASREHRIVEALSGHNPVGMMITFAVTGSMGEPQLKQKANPSHPNYGYNISTLISPGDISSIEGLDAVRARPGVLDVSIAHAEGDVLPVEALGQLRQIAVRTVGVAENQADLERAVSEIGATISLLGVNGEDLTLPPLIPHHFENGLLE